MLHHPILWAYSLPTFLPRTISFPCLVIGGKDKKQIWLLDQWLRIPSFILKKKNQREEEGVWESRVRGLEE